jgi:histidinol-phosphate aminotransferase
MLKPRSSIQNLHPYHSPILTRDALSLDLNENMAGCSPHVLARLRALTVQDVSLYPQREEGEKIVAKFLGIAPEQVLLTNGMDDALALLFSAYLGRGDELMFADPTFVMYPMLGQACGANVMRLASGEDLELPVAEFLRDISPRTRLIAIANPNNPTGLLARHEDLLGIVESAPDAAVLIDEAYFEFCGETLMGDLERYPNLFVARTFSKVYGLAGLRLGVLAGAAEQIGFIRRFCPPFNVNGAALACVEAALNDQDFATNYVDQMKDGCRRMERLCHELGLHFWPSSTNFVLVRVGEKVAAFVDIMRERGIIVRNSSGNPGCAGCVRITAGTREQMERVLQAIRESVEEIRK